MDGDLLLDALFDPENGDVYDGDALGSVAACRRVLIRLKGRHTIVELVCLQRHHHRGAHRYVTVERVRRDEPVVITGGVL